MPYDVTGIGVFPTALPAEAAIWGPEEEVPPGTHFSKERVMGI